MNKAAAYFAISALAGSAALFMACDEDTVPLRALSDEGGSGGEGGTVDSGPAHPGQAQQSGRIVILGQEGTGVPGATINIGGKTVTSDAKGNYSVLYPLDTPVDMVITAPNYYKLLEGQWLLKQDRSRGSTRLPSVDTAKTLLRALSLTGIDVNVALGVISVWAIPLAGCPSEGGVTFDISPRDASTNLVYLKAQFPDTSLTSGGKGENPHVVIYNVPIGKDLTIIAKHPTCSQLPFPQDDVDGFTYTGKVNLEADNQTLSFFRVFMGPHVDVDAGPDASFDGSFDATDQ